MATLKINDQIVRIKAGNHVLEDIELYEIDRLTTLCGKEFLKYAYESNIIDKSTYQDRNNKITIECDNVTLEPVFFDDKLKKVSKKMHEEGSITNDNDSFKNDINTLFKILSNDYGRSKTINYFKNNSVLVDYLNNYKNTSLEIIEYFKDYYNYRVLRNFIKENTSVLAISLNSDNTKYKVLYEGLKEDVDEYTMKFKDSKEIRLKYQSEIGSYLKENEELLNKSSRKNNGYIVILNNDTYGMVRKRVLYKDTKTKINAFTKNLKEVKELSGSDYNSNFFSPCERKIIKYQVPGKRTGYVKMMKDWAKTMFENKDYDSIRGVLHFVDQGYIISKEKHTLAPVITKTPTIKEDEEFLYEDEIAMMKGDSDYNYDYQNLKVR